MYALNLHLLGAGPTQGLVMRLQDRFHDQTGVRVQSRFGPVDSLRQRLQQPDEHCDLVIAPPATIAALTEAGELLIDGQSSLGLVRLCIAQREGDPPLAIDTREALRQTLLEADSLHFAEPQRDVAGRHFAAVLMMLGLLDQLKPRCKLEPDGASALRAMKQAPGLRPLACALLSEIRMVEGIVADGALPPEFALACSYTAAVTVRADDPALADRFVALLCGADSREERDAAGFEPLDTLLMPSSLPPGLYPSQTIGTVGLAAN